MSNRSMPPGSVIPELPYTDVLAAARWLTHAFGFVERLRIGTHRVQLAIGDGSMVAVEAPPDDAPPLSRVMVAVPNVDVHYAHAVSAGAQTLSEPTTFPFGERQYSALDLGGHRWTFSQTVADVDPSTWGGVLVDR